MSYFSKWWGKLLLKVAAYSLHQEASSKLAMKKQDSQKLAQKPCYSTTKSFPDLAETNMGCANTGPCLSMCWAYRCAHESSDIDFASVSVF